MSLKINFFPLHFILSLCALITGVIVFSDIVYVYFSTNVYVNGLIIGLFILCMLWLLGVLSYYSRSANVINKLFSSFLASKARTEVSRNSQSAMYITSAISGTLIDGPVASKILSLAYKSGKLELSMADAELIVDSVASNGDRVLGLSKFLTSLFTMLGLFGTFVGLLETIDGVGLALASVSDVANVDIFGLVKLLADPLQGMAVAFSASLFGLISALYGNYGNYVASQRLAVFVNKLKNYLIATTISASVVDPTEVRAEDILLALEDSFNKLSMTFADKLDAVSEGLLSMSKVIARGQDRQEKLAKATVINLMKVVEGVNSFDGIADDIVDSIDKNRVEFLKYIDDNIARVISKVSDSLEFANKIAVDHVEVSEKQLGVAEGLADSVDEVISVNGDSQEVLKDILDVSEKHSELVTDLVMNDVRPVLLSIDDKTLGVNYTEDFNDVIGKLTESNTISSESVGLAQQSNTLLGESNDIADSVLSKVATEETLDEAVGALGEIIKVADSSLAELSSHRPILSDTVGALGEVIKVADSSLAELSSHRPILSDAVGALGEVIKISDSSLAELSSHRPILSDAVGALGEIIKVADSSLAELSSHRPILSDTVGALDEIIKISDSSLNELSSHKPILSDAVGALGEIIKISDSSLNELSSHKPILSDAVGALGEVIRISDSSLDELSKTADSSARAVVLLEREVDLSKTHVDISIDILSTLKDDLQEVVALKDTVSGFSTVVTDKFDEQNYLSRDILTVTSGLLSNSESLLGSVDNITGEVAGVTEMVSLVYDGVSAFLPTIHDTMKVIADSNSYLNNEINSLSEVLRETTSVVSDFIGVVSVLDTRMERLEVSTTNLDVTLQSVLPLMYQGVEVSSSNAHSLGYLINILGEISNKADSISGAFNNFADLVLRENAEIANQVNTVGLIISNARDGIVGALTEVYSVMTQASGAAFEAVEKMSNAANSMYEAANQTQVIMDSAVVTAESVSSMAMDFSDLREMYSAQMGELSDLLGQSVSTVLNTFDYIAGNMVDLNDLVSAITSFSNEMSGNYSAIVKANEEFMSMFLDSHNQFFSNLSDNMNFVSSTLTAGTNELVSVLQHVSSSIEDHGNMLNALNTNLGSLPDNVGYIMSDIGNVFVGMQDMVSSLSAYGENANAMVSEAMINTQDASRLTQESASLMIDLANQNRDLNSSIYSLSSDLVGIFGDMGSLTNEMGEASRNLYNISSELVMQSDSLDRNSEVLTSLAYSIDSLAVSSESLRDVGGSLSVIVDSFMSLSDTLSKLDNSAVNMDNTFSSYSQVLTAEMSRLIDTMNAHLQTFVSKDVQIYDDVFMAINDIMNAVNNMNMSTSSLEMMASQSVTSNQEVKNEISMAVQQLVGEVATIKNVLGSSLSERIISEISNIASNQSVLLSRVDGIMPQIDNLINALYDNKFDQRMPTTGGGNNSSDVVNALIQLREEHANGNIRLDVVANAIDSLITEMLNSRDVAESILDVVSKLYSEQR